MKPLAQIIPAFCDEKQESADYVDSKSGLLYCGLCNTPKQLLVDSRLGKNIVFKMCECKSKAAKVAADKQAKREQFMKVRNMKINCIHDKNLHDWTFANDNGQNPTMERARKYVEDWEEMKQDNIGLLLWGDVGTGKSYFAACIANALIEQNIPVLMTNFAKILNSLGSFYKEDRNEYIQSINHYPLLIIDDLGVERESKFALEQVYNVIDSRTTSRKPLIVTSNLHLDDIKNPSSIEYSRIYSRLSEMCVPIRFAGKDMRKEKGHEKLRKFSKMLE